MSDVCAHLPVLSIDFEVLKFLQRWSPGLRPTFSCNDHECWVTTSKGYHREPDRNLIYNVPPAVEQALGLARAVNRRGKRIIFDLPHAVLLLADEREPLARLVLDMPAMAGSR